MLSHLTAALALAATVADASPLDLKKRSFSLQQVERTKFLKNGPKEIAKTLRKFGGAVPSHVLDAADARANAVTATAADGNGSAPAVPGDEYDSLYLTPVTLGTTEVQLDCDTGSADLWTFSSLQPRTQLTGHQYYEVDSGKAIQGASWNISYGDGSGASGTVYADKVTVGGITATRQAVEAATSVSAQFQQDQDTDGLLGLAFSTINTVEPQQETTFFDTVKADLAQPLFAVTLKYHAAGTYDFGFIDDSKYTGEITYVDIDSSNGFWQFTADGYAIGSGSTTSSSIAAIADTGTTLVYLPSRILQQYYSQVANAQNSRTYGGYVFPCSTTLPDFTFVIGGAKQTIPGKYINYAPVQQGSSTCFGGLQPNTGLPFSILGDIFLKSKYAVHEAGDSPRIGFAEQSS